MWRRNLVVLVLTGLGIGNHKVLIAGAVLAALLQVEVSAQGERWLKGSEMNAARRATEAAMAFRNEQVRKLRDGSATSGVVVSAASNPRPDDTVTTTSARYIPHLAQGQGWETYLDVINTCSEPVEYRIRFYGADGTPTEFEFGEYGRFSGIHHGDSPLGNSIDSFHLTDTGTELLQGAGMVVENGGGCVAVDTFYVQSREDEDGNEYSLYATVPLSRLATEGSVLTFLNLGSCETHMAITGTGEAVRIKALKWDGSTLGSMSLNNVYHTAFSLSQRIPATNENLGMLRISGEAAVVGIDFCSGNLAQFRLPHLAPMTSPDVSDPEPPSDDPVVVESFVIKLTNRGFLDYTYGIKLKLRNPTAKDQVYKAKIQFKDLDGFLVEEVSFWPGETNYSGRFCYSGTTPIGFDYDAPCEGMPVSAGQSREFLGNIELSAGDGQRVDLEESTLWIGWEE